MEKLVVRQINVNFNNGGDCINTYPHIGKECNTRDDAINYLNSREFYDRVLDYLEDEEVEDYEENRPESYASLVAKYGGSIIIMLNDKEEIYGSIYIRYQRRRGYVIEEIEYEYE